MNQSIKFIFFSLIICLVILGGCSFDEKIVSNDVSENMYGVCASDDNEIVQYYISDNDCIKSVEDENLEELSVVIYYRVDDSSKGEYIIYDFDRQYCFDVNMISCGIRTKDSIFPADNETKESIISKMLDLKSESWWGETYDVNSKEIRSWYSDTEYNYVWHVYFCFSNGDVAELYGVGYDGAMYAPEGLDEFLRYLRSFIGK